MRTKELKSHLVNRGYERMEVQHQIDRATIVGRKEALMYEYKEEHRQDSNGGHISS